MSTVSNNTALEELIAECRAAEEVGVFSRTRVDLAVLTAQPAPTRLVRVYERIMVGLPLAACLAIVVGLALQSGGPRGLNPTPLAVSDLAATTQTGAEACSISVMASCISGPGAPVTGECVCADLDRDGDVDLLDLGSLQRQADALN